MDWIDNAIEKFGKALQLWRSSDPWETRAENALLMATRILTKDLPEKFRPAYLEFVEAATRVKDARHGAIKATVNQMDETEATRLIERLERLYHGLWAYKSSQR